MKASINILKSTGIDELVEASSNAQFLLDIHPPLQRATARNVTITSADALNAQRNGQLVMFYTGERMYVVSDYVSDHTALGSWWEKRFEYSERDVLKLKEQS